MKKGRRNLRHQEKYTSLRDRRLRRSPRGHIQLAISLIHPTKKPIQKKLRKKKNKNRFLYRKEETSDLIERERERKIVEREKL